MSDVLEVRPGAVRPEDLAAFERTLEAVAPMGQTPRLVGPDGAEIDLPEGIHALLVSIVENLKAGNGVAVIPMHAELTTIPSLYRASSSRSTRGRE